MLGAKNKGMIILSGGGDADKTKIIDSLFLKHLSRNNIYFIPIAKTSDKNGYSKSCMWLKNKFYNLNKISINVKMILDLKNVDEIDNDSAIYIGGGNTYKLLKIMHDSKFLPILKKHYEEGGLIYGASAGAVIMGLDISTYIVDKYIKENEKFNYTLSSGLSLIGNYSILTHYNENENMKVKEYFLKYSNPIIAIPEGSGILVSDKSMRVIEGSTVTIFENSRILRKLSQNKVLLL